MKNDNFSCENCGGMMRFDSRTQSLKCENCGTEKELPRTLTWERHRLNEYDHLLKNEKNAFIMPLLYRSVCADL